VPIQGYILATAEHRQAAILRYEEALKSAEKKKQSDQPRLK
jgi:hypothetical protein